MPMKSFLSPEPIVSLDKAFSNPFRNIVATAKTCYSSKGIISDDQIDTQLDPMSRDMEIAKSIYEAGHHTTLQHAYFQFKLDNISRQFIWSFLHSHPFYNSEQVSQRYVEIKPGMYAIPPLEGEALAVYQQTVEFQIETYHRLIEMLKPITASEYYTLFPGRAHYPDHKKYRSDIKKKSQEIARYVMPVATLAYMYHTVSGLTLLRYYRLCQQFDVPLEQQIVVQKMVDELLRFDPLYEQLLVSPIPTEDTPEYAFFAENRVKLSRNGSARRFTEEFDANLEGRVSKLVDYKINNEKVLAKAVREVMGLSSSEMNDDVAIDLVLHPAKNKILGESLVLTTHSKLSRALFHASYTFRKKLSHAADSQDQRHRMTPASRPILHTHLSNEPDYITPELIKVDASVHRTYDQAMQRIWESIDTLRRLAVPDEFAMYLLPNAVAVRFTESSDLLNLHHKLAMRLCYNAQEEIWRASLDEAMQIREVNPRIGKYLLPPCGIRHLADTRPICPEGERFCGIKVWRLQPSEYERVI